MNTDKALANFEFLWNLRGGDTGRGRVEHRSFKQLRSTLNLLKTGYKLNTLLVNFDLGLPNLLL